MFVPLAFILPTDLTELQRLPRQEAANARIGVLIEERYTSKLKLAVKPTEHWRRALIANDHALRCWEPCLKRKEDWPKKAGQPMTTSDRLG
jgi:hypothetical protein